MVTLLLLLLLLFNRFYYHLLMLFLQDIEKEMARTQKNKATASHLGTLKASWKAGN